MTGSGVKIAPSTELRNTSRLRSANIGMGCPEFQVVFDSAIPGNSAPFRSFTLTKGRGYAFVAIHFSKLWLPRGVSVVLRAVEGFDTPDRTLNLSMKYPSGQAYSNVQAPPILAKEFRIEFLRDESVVYTTDDDVITATFSVSDSESECFGFVVDSYDYVLMDDSNPIVATDETICAADNTMNAICYYADNSTLTAYLASRSVVRLKIPKGNGESAACTGWLLGNQGHIMTNYHCIATDVEASGTTVEFMAESRGCTDGISSEENVLKTNTVFLSMELVPASEVLDYALLKLPMDGVQAAQFYGYLRLKTREGVVGEQLYIPQHPMGYNKRISVTDDYEGNVALRSLSTGGCGAIGYSYSGDTRTGSSGSPVLSFSDHGVVALHHCGEMCANTGIPSKSIVADLQANGISLDDFDGIDDGSSHTSNAERFPMYTPPDPVEELPLTPRLTVDGAIILASSYVTIDKLEFTLNGDTHVSFAVVSVEIADNDTFIDLNGDCRASYLDSTMFLFPRDDTTPVFFVDDMSADSTCGSISYRDPYKNTFLKKGSYVLAIAPTGSSESDALAGKTKVVDAPELYSCRDRSSFGSYRLQVSSTIGDNPFEFTSLPAAIEINPELCRKTTEAICLS